MNLYDQVLDVLGGTELTLKMQEYAYLTSCVLLVVGCWAMVKIATWLFKI